MGRSLAIACVIVAFTSWAPAQTRPVEPLDERVARVAKELPWLNEGTALFDQSPWGPTPERVPALLKELEGDWKPDEVRPLLHSKSAKVRTLAIVMLFRMDRVDVLPDIAKLADDNGVTFSEPGQLSNYPPAGTPWPMDGMTVGKYARYVLGNYSVESPELADRVWNTPSGALVD